MSCETARAPTGTEWLSGLFAQRGCALHNSQVPLARGPRSAPAEDPVRARAIGHSHESDTCPNFAANSGKCGFPHRPGLHAWHILALSSGRPMTLRPRTVGVTAFVVMALLAALTVLHSERARRQHERALIAGHIRDYAHHLETYITRALSASYALAALVEAGGGDVPDFDVVAERLLPHYPGASEVLLAPNGVIQQ